MFEPIKILIGLMIENSMVFFFLIHHDKANTLKSRSRWPFSENLELRNVLVGGLKSNDNCAFCFVFFLPLSVALGLSLPLILNFLADYLLQSQLDSNLTICSRIVRPFIYHFHAGFGHLLALFQNYARS